jgi:hypothetical protein
MKLKYHSIGNTDFIMFEPETQADKRQLEIIINERMIRQKRFEAIRFQCNPKTDELCSLTLPIQKN